jgi:hypothetical protein
MQSSFKKMVQGRILKKFLPFNEKHRISFFPAQAGNKTGLVLFLSPSGV